MLVLVLQIEKVLVQHVALASYSGQEVLHELLVEHLFLRHIFYCQALVAPVVLVLVSFDSDAFGLYEALDEIAILFHSPSHPSPEPLLLKQFSDLAQLVRECLEHPTDAAGLECA